MPTSRTSLSLVSTLALAALLPTAALAQTAAAPAAAATRAGLHAHRERRDLQRIHLPGHLTDRRQACRARRLRLGAFERLLSRHVGIEHQLARGFRRLHAVEPRVGFLRRLQGQLSTRLELRPRHDLLLLPGQSQSRFRERQHLGTLRGAQLEVARRQGVVQPRRTTSARSPSARRRTARGISTSTPTIRSANRASRCSDTSGS